VDRRTSDLVDGLDELPAELGADRVPIRAPDAVCERRTSVDDEDFRRCRRSGEWASRENETAPRETEVPEVDTILDRTSGWRRSIAAGARASLTASVA
jgi:hypothetical protein